MTDLAAVTADAPADPAVRLAELVAALSLGVDLGFGQPMEHVLRQCLIALRLAERVGLDDSARSVVYYTALLVNVGCHSDAHEQAKWFGDDIELKSGKYDHEPRSIAGAAAAMRLCGPGNPPLHRFRVGLEFALSGHRELDGMIAQHAAIARSLAEQLGLPDAVQEAVGASYEQWDGQGWPGELGAMRCRSRRGSRSWPSTSRWRTGSAGPRPRWRSPAGAAGRSSTRRSRALLCADAEAILGGLDAARTWDAVIGAEPALGVLLSGERFDAALLGVANFVDLKSPYTLGHARAVAELAAAAGRSLGWPGEVRRCGGPGSCTASAGWACRTRSGTSAGRSARASGSACDAPLPDRADAAPVGCAGAARRDRRAAPRAPRRLGIPARPVRRGDLPACPHPRRRGRLPVDARAAALPALRSGRGGRGELRAEVKAGRLDADAVEAVLAAAGHRVVRRRECPAGLTAREVNVLRLLRPGLSSKQIADRLVISPKTARNHIEHIYVKIGASSRAAASLFAMQHGLLPEHVTS